MRAPRRVGSTLEQIRCLPHIAFVDDERSVGNSIIVTLEEGYEFRADPGCGVMGFDTVVQARDGTRKHAVILKAKGGAA